MKKPEYNYKFQAGEKAWINTFNRPTQVIIEHPNDSYWLYSDYTFVYAGTGDGCRYAITERKLAKTKKELCEMYIKKTQEEIAQIKEEMNRQLADRKAVLEKWQKYMEESDD